MAVRRNVALSLLVVVLLAGPALKLVAAVPCPAGAPMTCCDDQNGAPAPCGCTLKPAPPSPAVTESAPPDVVAAEAPVSQAMPEPAMAAPASEPVTPRARSAPLFVLFGALLN